MGKALQRPISGIACESTEEGSENLASEINQLERLDVAQLRLRWRNHLGGTYPAHLPRWLVIRLLAYRLQTAALGGLDTATLRKIRDRRATANQTSVPRFAPRLAETKEGAAVRPGALLVREWRGDLHRVMVLERGFAWNGGSYSSLSKVARAITGVNWNGHRFFGLRKARTNGRREAPDAR